jgi:hypothetical protein
MTKKILLIILFGISIDSFCLNITLTYKITKTGKQNQSLDEISGNKNVQPEQTTSFEKVILFDNNCLVLLDSVANTKIIYDFFSEKITRIDKKSYDNVPLFSIVNYRESEFQNRKFLSTALQAGGINDAFGGTFGLELLFVLEDKPGKFKMDIKEQKENSLIKYYYKNEKIVSVEYSQKKLDNKYRDVFNKFLIYNTSIHPLIINSIVQNGFIPRYFEYSYSNVAAQYCIKYELTETSGKEQSLEQLMNTSGMFQDSVNRDSLELLLDKTFNKINNGDIVQINKDECLAKNKELIGRQKYFDALLTLFEYILQSGEQPADAMKSTMNYLNKDNDMRIFVGAINSEFTKEALEKSIKKLESIDQNKYEKGYLINIFLANFYTNIGFNKSLHYFQKVLVKNPYITGIFKDLGDYYANTYNMDYAWKCYDMALLLNKNHPMSKEIEEIKSRFRKSYPGYFLSNMIPE